MRRAVVVIVAAAIAALAGTAAPGGGVATAGAQDSGIRPTPDRASTERRAAARLARSIARKRKWVRRAAFSALPPFSDPAAIARKRLGDFPRHGRSFAILSTGDAKDADDSNDAPDTSSSIGGPSVRGARDVTILRIELRVPRRANCLSFRFKFLSEEFPEFVDDQYNDGFVAELGTSDWTTFSKEDPRIEAPNNFAVGSEGRLVTVNQQGDTSVAGEHSAGTTYDGATPVLRASTRVLPGRQLLYLSLFDQGDREYDSAVFVDNLVLARRSACQTGAVVED